MLGNKKKRTTLRSKKADDVSEEDKILNKVIKRGDRPLYTAAVFKVLKAFVDTCGDKPENNDHHNQLKHVANTIKEWGFPHSVRHFPTDATQAVPYAAYQLGSRIHVNCECYRTYDRWVEGMASEDDPKEVTLPELQAGLKNYVTISPKGSKDREGSKLAYLLHEQVVIRLHETYQAMYRFD